MAPNGSYIPTKKSLINDMRISQSQDKNDNVKLVEAAFYGMAFVVALGAIALYLKSRNEDSK